MAATEPRSGPTEVPQDDGAGLSADVDAPRAPRIPTRVVVAIVLGLVVVLVVSIVVRLVLLHQPAMTPLPIPSVPSI